MSLTLTEARDDMFTMVKDAWDTTGFTMLWQDQAGEKPSTTEVWARTVVQHNLGGQETLSGETGSKRFYRRGVVTVQIFCPVGEGLSSADTYAKVIMDAFEGKTSANGVWFRNTRAIEVGSEEGWYQINVITDFEYAEIK